jgi:hypothetical protein
MRKKLFYQVFNNKNLILKMECIVLTSVPNLSFLYVWNDVSFYEWVGCICKMTSLRCLQIGTVMSKYPLTDTDQICAFNVCEKLFRYCMKRKYYKNWKYHENAFLLLLLKPFKLYNQEPHIQVVLNQCLLAV